MGRRPKSASIGQESLQVVDNILKKRIRDPQTGLLPGYDYKFNEDGTINWEAMIPSEFFYPNKDRFDSNVDLKSLDVATLPPDKRILSLDGIKYLIKLRGAKNIEIEIGSAFPEYASVSCRIEWVKSIDQGMEEWVSVGAGDAHAFNNVPPFKYLLVPLAENKALSRAVRMGCFVKTYTADELRGDSNAQQNSQQSHQSEIMGTEPYQVLEKLCNDNGFSFEKIKSRYLTLATEDEKETVQNWVSFKDIDVYTCYKLLGLINKKITS